MKQKKSIYGLLLMFLLMLAMSQSVSAAVQNPLKNTKSLVLLVSGAEFKGSLFDISATKNFTLTVKSSNSKVATVGERISYKRDNRYYKTYHMIQKGYGTTKLTFTAKIDKKTFTKTVTLIYKKYTNPFTSLKIGGKEYASKLNKGTYKKVDARDWHTKEILNPFKLGNVSGKVSIKMKPGYKVTDIIIKNNKTGALKLVKNITQIPKGYSLESIMYTYTKTNEIGRVKFS